MPRNNRLQYIPQIQPIGYDQFVIQSFSDPEREYWVDLEEMTCTCPGHEIQGCRCRHMVFLIDLKELARKKFLKNP